MDKRVWLVLCAGLFQLGCGAFFGSDRDQEIQRPKEATACGKLDLSSLPDRPKFEHFLRCLNKEGQIQPIADWFSSLANGQKDWFVRYFNQSLLNPTSLKALEQTLPEIEKLDWNFLTDERFRKIVSRGLPSLKKFSDVDPLKLMDQMILLLSSPALSSLLEKVKHQDLSVPLQAVHKLIQKSGKSDAMQLLLDQLAQGKLQRAVVRAGNQIGHDPYREVLPQWVVTLRFWFASHSSRALKGLSHLFFLSKESFPCLHPDLQVENGLSGVVQNYLKRPQDQWEGYLKRDEIASIVGFQSVCEFPSPMDTAYDDSLFDLGRSHALFPTSYLLGAFFQHEEVFKSLTQTFQNWGHPENQTLERLGEIFSFVESNALWGDLIVLFHQVFPDKESWQNFGNWAGALYPEWRKNLSDQTWEELQENVSSLLKILTESRKELSFLREMREVFYTTPNHPFLFLIQNLATEAKENPDHFDKVIEAFNDPNFHRMVQFLSEEKRSQNLLNSLFNLFRKELNRTPIQKRPVPPLQISPWKGDLLPKIPVWRKAEDLFEPCRALDLDQGISEQWDLFAQCLGNLEDYLPLIDALNYLRNEKNQNGMSYFDYLGDWFQDFLAHFEHTPKLVEELFRALDDGTLEEWFEIIRFWTDSGSHSLVGDGILMFSSLKDKETEIRVLEKKLADHLESQESLQSLRYLKKIYQSRSSEPPPKSPDQTPEDFYPSFRIEWLKEQVRKREGVYGSDRQLKRVHQLIDDYYLAVSNDWHRRGHPRRSWDHVTLRRIVDQIIDKFSDPRSHARDRTVVESVSRIFEYYSLEEGDSPNYRKHAPVEELKQWFVDRSDDARLIQYLYPGEKTPRLKIVSSLDRFEILMVNSNIEVFGANLLYKILKWYAEAWGDEPRELWPKKIQKKFRYSRPDTMREVYEDLMDHFDFIDSISGIFPDSLKARIQNIKQVVSVAEENLPGSGTPHAGGLRLLRNIAYQLMESTPRSYRGVFGGKRNNFSLLYYFGEAGLFRQAGRQIRHLKEDPALFYFFKTLVHIGISGTRGKFVYELMQRPDQPKIFWLFFDQIFSLLSEEGKTPDLRQLGYYLMASLSKISEDNPNPERLTEEFMGLLADGFENDLGVLFRMITPVHHILASEDFSRSLRALFESEDKPEQVDLSRWLKEQVFSWSQWKPPVNMVVHVLEDPEFETHRERFHQTLEGLQKDPQYLELNSGEKLDQLVDWMLSEDPISQEFRQFAAQSLRRHHFSQFLHLAMRDPETFDQKLMRPLSYYASGPFMQLILYFRENIFLPNL